MIRRIATTVVSLTVALGLLAGCGSSAPKQESKPAPQEAAKQAPKAAKQTTYPITIKDAAGRDVTITAEPKRIVSVAPANTELVFALGKGANLVGRSDFDDYPAEVKNVPSIGAWYPAPNYEKIVAAKADILLLTSGSDEIRNKLISDYKQNVFVVAPNTFDEAYSAIKNLGLILNAQENADEVIAKMQAGVKEITDKVAKATTKPKVYYEVWYDPLMTAGADTYINDMIKLAGGTNVGADVKGWAPISAEVVAKANPDLIIASGKDDLEKLKTRTAWAEFTAIKGNKLFVIDDPNLVSRPGPRLVQGLKFFAQTIHPELFK